MESLNPLDVQKSNIWQFRQNKSRHIVRDLDAIAGVPPDISRLILKARGVDKWFLARRKLIKLKDKIKREIHETRLAIVQSKKDRDFRRRHYLRGRITALNETRQAIRDICHSPRWTE